MMILARGALLAIGLAGSVFPAMAADGCAPGAVFLVRHAEKADVPNDPDVELSELGKANAQALAAWFEGKSLDAIYTTHLRRTQQTALPLATARDLELRVLPAGDTPRLMQRLREKHCGQTVLVVGHSNTVADVAQKLGAEPFMIDESDFGWVYSVPSDSALVVRSRYAPEPTAQASAK
jgi:2,3-bisphosphoglycerate-dependent phosphoglycerate mutase